MNQDPPEVLSRVHDGLDLVNGVAREVARTMGRLDDIDEAIAYGREGLLDAARRYVPRQDLPFHSFAKPIIRSYTLDGMRKLCDLTRRKQQQFEGRDSHQGRARRDAERLKNKHLAGVVGAQAQGLLPQRALDTQQEAIALSLKTTPEDATVRGQEQGRLERGLEGLPDEEAFVIRRCYTDGLSVEQAARELGVSRAKAYHLHDRAIARLQKRLGPLR